MGTVDIYHSRRTNWHECLYWAREERSGVSPSEWVLKNRATGSFYAKEVNAQYGQMNQISNVFAFDRNGITLETDDDIRGIQRGWLVEYNGKAWIVQDIQEVPHRKESAMSVDIEYKYYINLRR